MLRQRRRFADLLADLLAGLFADFFADLRGDFFAAFARVLLAVRFVFLAAFFPVFAAFFAAFFDAAFFAEPALDVDLALARAGAFAELVVVIAPAARSCNAKPAPCGSPRIAIVPPGMSMRGRCTNAPAFVAMSTAFPTSFTWM